MRATTGGATPRSAAVRVVVADDHPLWREALVRDLHEAGFDVVGTAADGGAAVRRTRATTPDVLVLDLNLPDLPGDEVCRHLRDLPTRILILSASGEQADVLAAIKAGATGYLVKSASSADIRDAVLRTAAGDAVFTAGLAGLVLGEFQRMASAGQARREPTSPEAGSGSPGVPELTPREVEVLRLVALGMSSRQIAEDLVISHRTVQNHVQNTLTKLHLHNRVELARFAIEHGLQGQREDRDPADR